MFGDKGSFGPCRLDDRKNNFEVMEPCIPDALTNGTLEFRVPLLWKIVRLFFS